MTKLSSIYENALQHTIASHSDTSGTGAELDTLTDGSDSDVLHIHPTYLEATASGVLQSQIDTKIDAVLEDTTPQLGGDLDTNGSDILYGTDTISGTGQIITGDHGSATKPEVVNVIYGTGAAPTASTTTIGSLYIKYTV